MRDLVKILDRLGSPRLLVLGDLMLDRYTWGDATRVSPEAPVLVLRADMEEARLGGAASVAALLRGLDADVSVAGVLGEDADGRVVRQLLHEAGIDASLTLTDDTRPTTCKQRIVGRAAGRHPHQIIRVDQEETRPLAAGLAPRLSAAVAARLAHCQALLISDYGKGVCSRAVLAPVVRAARRAGIPVVVDPARDADYARYRYASLIKPNRAEAQSATGLPINSTADAVAAGRSICRQTRVEAMLVTLESDGMALVTRDGQDHLLAARARAVYDVTGAGDMALAALGLARAGGADWPDAAELAVAAAGLQVERFGVSPVSRAELRASFETAETREQARGAAFAESSATFAERKATLARSAQKVVTLARLAALVAEHRAAGRTIVLANGVFDLLHVGHVRCLQEAAAQGDVLVVAVNRDAGVRRLKGAGRPIVPARHRAQMVAALGCVDHVIVFGGPTLPCLLRAIKPDVLVKGGDYGAHEVAGREFVESYGGRVHVAGHVPGVSTTRLVEAIAAERRSACPCGRRAPVQPFQADMPRSKA